MFVAQLLVSRKCNLPLVVYRPLNLPNYSVTYKMLIVFFSIYVIILAVTNIGGGSKMKRYLIVFVLSLRTNTISI